MVSNVFLRSAAFLSILLACGSIKSQSLSRASYLGAQLMSLDAVEEDLGVDSGVFLALLLPEGSLGRMNVPAESILQEINGEKIESINDVFNIISEIKEGDSIEVVVYTDGNQELFSGTAVGKPKEDHSNGSVQYGEVKYEGNTLRSLLYLPNNVDQPPVIFFLQGYTCQSIEMRNNNPAKQLINQWVENGYAVFLVEKPGMGDSESKIPCMEIDFKQEQKAFSEAYEALLQIPLVDNKNIFLFGHSMGGVMAPLLAQETNPAGILVYGIVGENWYDYMIDLYTEQPLLFGVSKEQIKADNQFNLPFIEDLLIEKKSNKELIESPIYGKYLEESGTATALSEGYYINRHYTYWQSLADVDVPKTWAKVKAPVLVMHGEYDIQAINPKYGEMIAINVNENGGNADFELIPKSEHAFLKFESREELNLVMSNGTYSNTFETHFNDEIATKSMSWIQQHLNQK